MNKPPKTIYDKDFRYVPSTQTNIRKTFNRIRRELRGAPPLPPGVVVPLVDKRKK